MHLYMLAHMFMHKSYLLVCRPCFNTMKSWAFNLNLHLSLTDTPFVCFPCLFAFFACWLAFFLLSHFMLAISILLVCFVYLRFFLPLLFCWFSCLCLCVYTYGARTHGAWAWSPRRKWKGQDASTWLSQAIVVSRFRSLAFSLWLCTL